jgi:hypothetical protein
MRLVAPLAALLVVVLVRFAEADCRAVTDCSQHPCRHFQECDSAMDDSGPRLQVQPPAAPQRHTPPTVIAPESIPLIPPRDTSFCRRAYLCDGGRCSWQVICR